MACFFNSQHALQPRHDFVATGVRWLIKVNNPVPDVLLQRALQRRVAARDGGVVAGGAGGAGGGVVGGGQWSGTCNDKSKENLKKPFQCVLTLNNPRIVGGWLDREVTRTISLS